MAGREDLRVFGGEWPHFRRPTDEEFAEVARTEGWVKEAACGDCDGTGLCPGCKAGSAVPVAACPTCGGTGRERGVFVSRSQLESWLSDADKQYDLEASFERLLATLNQENTDG